MTFKLPCTLSPNTWILMACIRGTKKKSKERKELLSTRHKLSGIWAKLLCYDVILYNKLCAICCVCSVVVHVTAILIHSRRSWGQSHLIASSSFNTTTRSVTASLWQNYSILCYMFLNCWRNWNLSDCTVESAVICQRGLLHVCSVVLLSELCRFHWPGIFDTIISAIPGDLPAINGWRLLYCSVIPCWTVTHQTSFSRVSDFQSR